MEEWGFKEKKAEKHLKKKNFTFGVGSSSHNSGNRPITSIVDRSAFTAARADGGADAAHGGHGRKYGGCVDLVRNEFSAFDETYWSVQSLDVYRRADAPVLGLQQVMGFVGL